MVKHKVKNINWSMPGNETSYFSFVCSLLTVTNSVLNNSYMSQYAHIVLCMIKFTTFITHELLLGGMLQ